MTAKECRDQAMFDSGVFSGAMSARVISPKQAFTWMNRGAYQIAAQCLEMEGVATFATIAGQGLYRLPDDCVKVIDLVCNDRQLVSSSRQLRNVVDTQNGPPDTYAILSPRSVRLQPIPDSAETVTIHYYRRPTAVAQDSDDIDLPEELAQCVVDYVVWRIHRVFQPDGANQSFRDFQAGLGAIYATMKKKNLSERKQPRDEFYGPVDRPLGRIIVEV